MKVTYTGQTGFLPAQQKKLDAKFAKVSKLLDRRGEKEAHVIVTQERHLNRAEITVNYYDHPLVCLNAHADVFQAISGAVDKLEKQIVKLRSKRRDTARTPEAKVSVAVAAAPKTKTKLKKKAPRVALVEEPVAAPVSSEPQVFRVNHLANRKPMTVEEAILELDGSRNYMVYRDAQTDRITVLVRRNDGNFDLIES